ncbi:MAG: hypothetical protein OK439_05685 [Thaumarchaeota archaeon]|nr:hypothetical protein [Nitrososphaerota archaeon]
MQPLVEAAIVFSFLNAALLLGLLYLYLRILAKTHARYTLGLIIFATLLLVQNLITMASYLFMIGFYSWQLYPVLDMIGVFEFAGLIALFRVTL